MSKKFVRQNFKQYKKLSEKWVRPRGLHNKVRLNKRGNIKKPSIGYRNPLSSRGLINGLKGVMVSHIDELNKINPKNEIVILPGNLGLKKKLVLLKKAQELKINVLNTKNIEFFLKKIQDMLDSKKEDKKSKEKQKKKSKEESLKKAEEKEKKEKTEEEQKEKKEKEKKEIMRTEKIQQKKDTIKETGITKPTRTKVQTFQGEKK